MGCVNTTNPAPLLGPIHSPSPSSPTPLYPFQPSPSPCCLVSTYLLYLAYHWWDGTDMLAAAAAYSLGATTWHICTTLHFFFFSWRGQFSFVPGKSLQPLILQFVISSFFTQPEVHLDIYTKSQFKRQSRC